MAKAKTILQQVQQAVPYAQQQLARYGLEPPVIGDEPRDEAVDTIAGCELPEIGEERIAAVTKHLDAQYAFGVAVGLLLGPAFLGNGKGRAR